MIRRKWRTKMKDETAKIAVPYIKTQVILKVAHMLRFNVFPLKYIY